MVWANHRSSEKYLSSFEGSPSTNHRHMDHPILLSTNHCFSAWTRLVDPLYAEPRKQQEPFWTKKKYITDCAVVLPSSINSPICLVLVLARHCHLLCCSSCLVRALLSLFRLCFPCSIRYKYSINHSTTSSSIFILQLHTYSMLFAVSSADTLKAVQSGLIR